MYLKNKGGPRYIRRSDVQWGLYVHKQLHKDSGPVWLIWSTQTSMRPPSLRKVYGVSRQRFSHTPW